MEPSGVRGLGSLFILTPPPIDPKNYEQYRVATLAGTLRNSIEPFKDAPHGFYLIKGGLDGTSDAVFEFVDGDDIFVALDEAKRPEHIQGASDVLWDNVTTIPQPSRNATPNVEEMSRVFASSDHLAGFKMPTTPYIGMARTPTEDDRPRPRQIPSNVAEFFLKKDRNSVIPVQMATVGSALDVGYCMFIQFNENTKHEIDRNFADVKYKMPIDTADAPLWFLGRPPRLRYINKDGKLLGIEDMPENGLEMLENRNWCPQGPIEQACEDTSHGYGDGGSLRLMRWGRNYDVAMLLPAWDWASNQLSFSKLQLPRVVAYAVNDTIISQRYDGNIGLAVPGWTSPFIPQIFEREVVTLCDALRRGEHVESSPMRMLIRLIHPTKEKACGIRAQSFVHFGEFWPCAVDIPGQGTHVPTFGDKIQVFPTKHGDYTQWIVRLLSMTLLVPRTAGARPDLLSTDERDWRMIPINMPKLNSYSKPDASQSGIQVLLDTLTTESALPEEVVRSIRALWLNNDEALYRDNGLHLPSESVVDGCDIIFKFLGADGKEVPFRCTAKRFLQGGWQSGSNGLWYSQIRASEMRFILGVNFYWTAFVRHDAIFDRGGGSRSGDRATNAYIRLAPQRIPAMHGRRFEEEDIKFLENAPGRLHKINRGLPQLKFD